MTGLEPALITGGASLLGGILSNRANAKQAQAQMNFQERMSSTAHQREVQDLRAAGLNPILSANKGASTPSGAMADIKDVLSPAVASAQAARRLDADLQNLKETNSQIQQDTKKKAQETKLLIHQTTSAAKQAEIDALKLKALQEAEGMATPIIESIPDHYKNLKGGIEKTYDDAGEYLKKKFNEIFTPGAPARRGDTGQYPEEKKRRQRQKELYK